MALSDDLTKEVAKVFGDKWTERSGTVVPDSTSLGLGNDAIKLDATVLYADLADSTRLVDSSKPHFAAEIYKAFLHCAAKIIRDEGGEITAYDGDRIMAVFIGVSKNTTSARTALKINYARNEIVNPALKAQYPASTYQVRHVVGVDTSPLFVARTGVRGANDLVWVGRSANHAAKMSALTSDFPSRITEEVYQRLQPELKHTNGKAMWERVTWPDMGRVLYRSTWQWSV